MRLSRASVARYIGTHVQQIGIVYQSPIRRSRESGTCGAGRLPAMLWRPRARLPPSLDGPMTTTRETPCTFCDLIRGAGEVSVCYEDGAAVAFMDIQPVNAGHVLVVPREHHESLFDVPPELGDHLFHVTMRLAS